MTDHRISAPRRYFVDARGDRVLIGLSLEETTEFETLDGGVDLGEIGPTIAATAAHTCAAARDTRWLELYSKHDQAWKAWIAQTRARLA